MTFSRFDDSKELTGKIPPLVNKPCDLYNLDKLFKALRKDNENTKFKGEFKNDLSDLYEYYFAPVNEEFANPLKKITISDTGNLVYSERASLNNLTLDALNNVTPILHAYGQTDLMDFSVRSNKTSQPRTKYQISILTNGSAKKSYNVPMETDQLKDLNINHFEGAIYRSVIDGLVYSICEGDYCSARIKPYVARYIDSCIEDGQLKAKAMEKIVEHYKTYDRTFCMGSQGVYTNPERTLDSHPLKYMTMAILFAGYYYDKMSKSLSVAPEVPKQVSQSQQTFKLATEPTAQFYQEPVQPVAPPKPAEQVVKPVQPTIKPSVVKPTTSKPVAKQPEVPSVPKKQKSRGFFGFIRGILDEFAEIDAARERLKEEKIKNARRIEKELELRKQKAKILRPKLRNLLLEHNIPLKVNISLEARKSYGYKGSNENFFIEGILNPLTGNANLEVRSSYGYKGSNENFFIEGILDPLTGSVNLEVRSSYGYKGSSENFFIEGILDPLTGSVSLEVRSSYGYKGSSENFFIEGILDPLTGSVNLEVRSSYGYKGSSENFFIEGIIDNKLFLLIKRLLQN